MFGWRPGSRKPTAHKQYDKLEKLRQPVNLKQLRIYLIVLAGEGLLASLMLFSIPSEGASAWLFGYSRARILLGTGALAVVWVLAAAAIWTVSWRSAPGKQLAGLDRFFLADDHLQNVSLYCVFNTAAIAALFTLSASQLASHLGMLPVVVDRASFILAWAGLGCVQTNVFLWFN